MADIKETIGKIALKDLAYTKAASSITGGSNYTDPSPEMIGECVDALRAGKTPVEIKKLVKVPGTNHNLSFGQIKAIHKAMDERIANLKPAPAEVE